jgi:hypothetical protein
MQSTVEVSALLKKLAADQEAEIAKAAGDALKIN